MTYDDGDYPQQARRGRGYGGRPESGAPPEQPWAARYMAGAGYDPQAEDAGRPQPVPPQQARPQSAVPAQPAYSRSAAAGAASWSAGEDVHEETLDGNVNNDVDLDELDPKGRAARVGAKRRAKAPSNRKKKVLKYTALTTAGVVAAVVGLGAYVISHLDGNIKHTQLLPSGMTQAAEIPDKFGNTPMNILLIGTDARVTAADCSLGGDCSSSGSGNSDVLMLIHLAADRSNSTIMSIPRDTMTNIPNCGGSSGGYGMINSSLAYGADCTVATVHQMTGLTIDHYMMVDFSGVVSMSNALGGVPVCVSNSMYDKDSGLRLPAGTSTIEGTQALEFVRTRHGFYDGSDLGREKAQHIFLSNMIRTLRSQASFTDITNLYSIADAATKSLTVDDGLSGVTSLISLFDTMNKIPTNRVTFVTMPWELDPANQNRVIMEQSQAEQMFTNIKGDVPYSAGSSSSDAASLKSESNSATSTATAEATPAAGGQQQAQADGASNVVTSEVHAQILNGTGISGRASSVEQTLVGGGFSSSNLSTGNYGQTASQTVVDYPSGRSDSAAAVAQALNIPSSQVQESSRYSEVTVVVGSDWTSGGTYSAAGGSGASSSSTGPAPTAAASAPSQSSALNAATTGQCVQVASNDIVN